MKRKLIIPALIFNFSALNAQTAPSVEGQFAVLKPKYSCEVTIPPGRSHNQIYFSKDCQTAYVLPSLNMRKTVLRPYFTADTGICDRYEQVKTSLGLIEGRITKLEETISRINEKLEAATDPETIKMLREKLAYFKGEKESLLKDQNTRLLPFYQTRAVRSQIRVESDIMDEIAAFQAANLANTNTSGKIYPIRFAPAIIDSSILGISPAGNSNLMGKSVLLVNFPGIPYIPAKSEDRESFPKNATLLEMNGSMSGIVDLSAVTYCDALKMKGEKVSTSTEDLKAIFNSAVALNLQYKVRVQAGVKVSLTSSIETRDFLTRFQNKITKTAFTRDELLGSMIEGEVINGLDIQLDDKGDYLNLGLLLDPSNDEDEGNSAQKEANFIAPLISKFTKEYLELVQTKMETLQLLTPISEIRAKEMNNGTTTEIGGTRTICNTKSGFLGLAKKTYCSQEPVYVQVNHAGISELLRMNADNSKIFNRIDIETNQTIRITHSSSFGQN